MSLPLTPEMLAAGYEYLRASPPFCRWKLPHSDEVAFAVSRHPVNLGAHQGKHANGTKHTSIEISVVTVGHTNTLLRVLAHEMIHLRQYLRREETPNTVHNAEFRRLAKSVCQLHGWDDRIFV